MAGPAAILVSAPASGQGKTTVTAGLARLHARAGARVRAFKCGPDFLDPQWLALATAHPVDSLDLWINGEADCAARLSAAADSADLIVVEGVMGLFDGTPSTADLAQRFALPVLAVIDASGMAGSFAAIVHGLRTWRRDLPWPSGIWAWRRRPKRATRSRGSTAPPTRWQRPHWGARLRPGRAGRCRRPPPPRRSRRIRRLRLSRVIR